jgi:hypothetical protein
MGRSEQFRPNSRSLPSARGQRSRIARARGIDAAISCPFRLLGVPNDQNGVFRDFRLLRSLADLVGRMRYTWDRRHPHRKENHHDDAQVSDRRPRGTRPLRTLSGHESGLGVGPSGMGAYHGQEVRLSGPRASARPMLVNCRRSSPRTARSRSRHTPRQRPRNRRPVRRTGCRRCEWGRRARDPRPARSRPA